MIVMNQIINMNYSIIIPFYNEEKNIESLNSELNLVLNNIKDPKKNFEIIYVDDGSYDNTFEELKLTIKNKIKTIIAKHEFNYSQSSSIITGISISNSENLIFLDGDMQNDPADIPKMLEFYENGYDMVSGWRKKRKDNFFMRTLPSILANFCVRLFSKSKLNDHGCALKILKKKIINYKISWGDFHRLLAARISFDNWKVKEIEVNHRERKSGKSKYNLNRVFRILIDLIYMNMFKIGGQRSIYFFGKFGLWSFFASLLSFIYMIYKKIFQEVYLHQTPLPILVFLFLFMGFLFLFIGLLSQLILSTKEDKFSNEIHIKDKIENNL